MKRFIAWARVSSVRQKKEGFSLEDQEARLTEFAQRLGGTIIKLFKIAETASKRDERATFREFTAFVKKQARTVDGMLFVKVDRAARNIRDWADLEELSEQSRVPLYFPDQPSAETAAGRMQRRMSAVFASYQTDQQSSDIRGGLKRRIENGLPLGRNFGLRSVRINGRSMVEHDPINGPKVRRVFELFAYHGHTLDSLTEALARQGVVYSDRKPRFWRATLYRMLTNRHYIGDVRFKGVWYPGKIEPLIDLGTFQAAQDRFAGRVYKKPQITFAGQLMRCGHCGHFITGEKKLKTSRDGTVREYSYYRCTHYSSKGHPRIRVSEAVVEQQFLALFAQMKIDLPGIRDWFVEVIKARTQSSHRDSIEHRKELERQRTLVDSKLSALIEMRMGGELSPEEFTTKRQELHERQAGIRLQLETTDQDDREIGDLAIKAFELSQSLESRWVTADYIAKRTILEILCEKVLLNSEKLDIYPRKPFDLISNGSLVSESGAEEIRTPDI